MRELKYDLNKSNLTMRPKTPDVSKIFYKHKNKKINYIKNVKNNIPYFSGLFLYKFDLYISLKFYFLILVD